MNSGPIVEEQREDFLSVKLVALHLAHCSLGTVGIAVQEIFISLY